MIETLCCPIPVLSGQVVKVECGNDEACELKLDFEDDTFEIETNAARLVVTATDECGNTASCEVDLCVADHDDSDDDANDDDDGDDQDNDGDADG